MNYDISVIFISYNQGFSSIRPTLESLLLQDCRSYEIVISDDGSSHFPLDDILALFEKSGFADFQIVIAEENQGIVRNILAGLHAGRGRYSKTISPGDMLFDGSTLSSIVSFADGCDLKAGFGKVVAYKTKDEGLRLSRFNAPSNASSYLDDAKFDEMRKSLLFADWIPGCSTFFDREFIIERYEELSRHYGVGFSEDLVMALIANEGCPIRFFNQNILWYDRNEGISSSGNEGSITRLYADHERFFNKLAIDHPRDRMLRKAKRHADMRKALSTSPLYGFLKALRERSYGSSRSESENDIVLDTGFLEKCLSQG